MIRQGEGERKGRIWRQEGKRRRRKDKGKELKKGKWGRGRIEGSDVGERERKKR